MKFKRKGRANKVQRQRTDEHTVEGIGKLSLCHIKMIYELINTLSL